MSAGLVCRCCSMGWASGCRGQVFRGSRSFRWFRVGTLLLAMPLLRTVLSFVSKALADITAYFLSMSAINRHMIGLTTVPTHPISWWPLTGTIHVSVRWVVIPLMLTNGSSSSDFLPLSISILSVVTCLWVLSLFVLHNVTIHNFMAHSELHVLY